MADLAVKKYSSGNIDWFLAEEDEDLRNIVGQFSHPENQRRQYGVYDYQGGKVFIKSFLEKGFVGRIRHYFSPRGKTEFRIGSSLASLAISTPRVLGYGTGKNTSAVVEEYIEGQSLLDAIKKTMNRDEIFTLLAGLLDQLKQKKVRHNDLHLDNVLICNNKLYLIDLHKTKVKKVFTDNDEISNFTHALGIIYDDISETERDVLFTRYGCNKRFRERVENEIVRLKKAWIIHKKKRAFRNTSLLKASRNVVCLRGSEEMAKGMSMAVLKEDKKVTVERFSDHIRKTYRNRRRLRRAWENHVALAYLRSTSIPQTFYVKLPGLFSKGHIAMEDLGGKGVELDRFLDGAYNEMPYPEKRSFIDELSRFLRSLYGQRIIHRDLKGCNIFALNDGTFRFLDVEDIVFREIDSSSLEKMLVQLNTTLPRKITTRDRIRFFIRLTVPFGPEKKQIFRNVVQQSQGKEIVYEGVGGLQKEQW